MISIRTGASEDVNELHQIGEGVSEFSVNSEIVTFWPKDILAQALASDDVIILVAHDEHRIVGFIIASYSNGLKKATIENIFVIKESRNKNIGNVLLSELLQRLHKRGCEYVATLIPNDAPGALYLYLNAGFTKGENFLWLDRSFSDNFKRS